MNYRCMWQNDLATMTLQLCVRVVVDLCLPSFQCHTATESVLLLAADMLTLAARSCNVPVLLRSESSQGTH